MDPIYCQVFNRQGTCPNMELLHCFSSCSSDGPVNATISGPSSLEVGVKATFTCSAICIPTCTYTWTMFGLPVKGPSINLTLNRYVETESISCAARNSVTGKTATINDTLRVSGPQSSTLLHRIAADFTHYITQCCGYNPPSCLLTDPHWCGC